MQEIQTSILRRNVNFAYAMPTSTTQVEICPQLISPDDLEPD